MTGRIPTPLDFASLKVADLDALALARELLDSDNAVQDGRSSRTLAKSNALTVVLTVIRRGQGLDEHRAPGPVMIVPLVGAAEFSSGQKSAAAEVLRPGRILMIGKSEKHRVWAREDSAFLIVIGSQA